MQSRPDIAKTCCFSCIVPQQRGRIEHLMQMLFENTEDTFHF